MLGFRVYDKKGIADQLRNEEEQPPSQNRTEMNKRVN